MSPQQVALAWELSLAEVVIPIPGASRPASIEDSVLAADLELSEEELSPPQRTGMTMRVRHVDGSPVGGERYSSHMSSRASSECSFIQDMTAA